MMRAKAVKSFEYIAQKQWISGYHLGYEQKDVWRVEIEIGRSRFLSSKTYKSFESANKAARRMESAA